MATMMFHSGDDQEEQEHKVTKKRKSRGFFAWLFGMQPEDEKEDWDEVKETARATLLKALQNERNNVEELEKVLLSSAEEGCSFTLHAFTTDNFLRDFESNTLEKAFPLQFPGTPDQSFPHLP